MSMGLGAGKLPGIEIASRITTMVTLTTGDGSVQQTSPFFGLAAGISRAKRILIARWLSSRSPDSGLLRLPSICDLVSNHSLIQTSKVLRK